MKENINKRISYLRSKMQATGIDAFLINGTDPHLSEYLTEHWQTRSFISGFTGSAGMVIVTHQKAALWTDSRYFLQAEDQLKGTTIQLIKMRTPGHPEPAEWLMQNLKQGDSVGMDEWCVSVTQFRTLKRALSEVGIKMKETGDLLNDIWTDRPPLPDSAVYEHQLEYACTDRKTKLNMICGELRKTNANMQILTALDDLAWTFNLRGNDVEFNPVFLAYASISESKTILFISDKKLPLEIRNTLKEEGIEIKNYNDLSQHLSTLPAGTKLLIDPDRTCQAILKYLSDGCDVQEGISIPCRLKAIKTDAEINNIRQAMRKDGVAMIEFLYWLNENLGKTLMDEYIIANQLTYFRSRQQGFMGVSFYPIVGYKEHGAIVHFHVTEKDALPISADGFLLFDSGGQYFDGTTDITRTVALAELTSQQKTDFTLVLKGMISLSMAKFPINTRGYHLDILARMAMWQKGLNYGHGTGHGVGYFLNVHEGPMSIRQEFNDRVIEAGMVLSNEPALYRPGQYGLRTENMMVCKKAESTEFGDFLQFETLTLCPIDINSIEISLLTTEEKEWLNKYHQYVYSELAPLVDDNLKVFLRKITKDI